MGAETSGTGNNLKQNDCGISTSHAFSVVTAFTI